MTSQEFDRLQFQSKTSLGASVSSNDISSDFFDFDLNILKGLLSQWSSFSLMFLLLAIKMAQITRTAPMIVKVSGIS